MSSQTLLARRVGGCLTASLGLALVLTATPASAAWQKTATTSGTAKAGTPSVTNVAVARTKCQGSNHTLTLTWNVPSDVAASTTVNIYKGTATNPTTLLTTANAAGGSFTDNNGNTSSGTFYKVELKYSTTWIASGQGNTATGC